MNLIGLLQSELLHRKILGLMLSEEGHPQAVCTVRKKDELLIVKDLSGFEEISGFLQNHPFIGITVCIDSRYIVHTLVSETITSENAIRIFTENVPNGNPEEFIIDYKENCMSFARRTVVESILEPFSKFRERMFGIYLAPTAGLALTEYLRSSRQSDSVNVYRFKYLYQGDRLIEMESVASQEMEVGGQHIDAIHVGSFLSVVNFLVRKNDETLGNEVSRNVEELFYKLVLVKSRTPILVILLIAFLGNTFLFFQYDKENQALKEKATHVRQLDRKLDTINKFIADNEQVLNASDVKFSLICDRLGYLTPSGITLSRIIVNPPSEQRGSPAFLRGQIRIEGLASNAHLFSDWLSTLNKQEWLLRIEKQTYSNLKGDGEKSSFHVIIQCDVGKINL